VELLGDIRTHIARAGRRAISPTDTTPTTHPIGDTKLTCSCGLVSFVDSKKLIEEGFECSCGKWKIPARGDPLKKEGRKVRKRYTRKGRRAPW